MRSLIIGNGEVGRALWTILVGHYEVQAIDKEDEPVFIEPEILHICFPYSDKFIDNVKEYQEKYNPLYTVIHSTVPVGTSKKVGAVHSPIRGIHPELERGIRTFPKFLGGERASEVADYFRRCGLRVILTDKAETTEYGKIRELLQYGLLIEFAKETKEQCNKLGIPFHEAYTLFSQTYNEGYKELGHPEFTKPVLQPIMKPIGGHCIRQNAPLHESKFNQFL